MLGRVIKSTGSWYTVKSEEGDYYDCRIKGKFRQNKSKLTNPVAVGDWVFFELEEYFILKFFNPLTFYIVRVN